VYLANGGLVVAFRRKAAYLEEVPEGIDFTGRREVTLQESSLASGHVPLVAGSIVASVSGRIVLKPEEDTPDLTVEILRKLCDRYQELGSPRLPVVIDVAGRDFSEKDKLAQLLRFLRKHRLHEYVRSLDLSGCRIHHDEIWQTTMLNDIKSWNRLSRLLLAENQLIKTETAHALLRAIQTAQPEGWVDVDLAYNAIERPWELRTWCKQEARSANLNVGPAWVSGEADRALSLGANAQSTQRKEAWERFMNGPAVLLVDRLQQKVTEWECPVCQKSLLAKNAMSACAAREEPHKPLHERFGDMLVSHLQGRNHRQKACAADPDQHVAEFKLWGQGGWSNRYFFNVYSGAQGWSREEATPQESDKQQWYFRRHQEEDHDVQVSDSGSEAGESEEERRERRKRNRELRDSTGIAKQDLRLVLQAVRCDLLPQTHLKPLEGEPGRFLLPDSDAFEATVHFEEEGNVQPEATHLQLKWRDYLRNQLGEKLYNVMKPTNAYLEVHPSARHFLSGERNPASRTGQECPYSIYLTVEICHERLLLHVSPDGGPLVALAQTNLVVARLKQDDSVRDIRNLEERLFSGTSQTLEAASKLASELYAEKPKEVIEAFAGSAAKLKEIKRTRREGVTETLRGAAKNFLKETMKKNPEDLVGTPDIKMDPETHMFEPSPILRQHFYEWLAGPSREDEYMQLKKLGEGLKELLKSVKSFEAAAEGADEYRCHQCSMSHRRWSHWNHAWKCMRCSLKENVDKVRGILNSWTQFDGIIQDLGRVREAVFSDEVYDNVSSLRHALNWHMSEYWKVLPIADLRVTHDTISPHFRHDGHSGQPLEVLIGRLKARKLDLEGGELKIEGAYYRGTFRAITNRRVACLWEAYGPDNTEVKVMVKVLPLVPDFRTERNQEFLFKFAEANSNKFEGTRVSVNGRRRWMIGRPERNFRSSHHSDRAASSLSRDWSAKPTSSHLRPGGSDQAWRHDSAACRQPHDSTKPAESNDVAPPVESGQWSALEPPWEPHEEPPSDSSSQPKAGVLRWVSVQTFDGETVWQSDPPQYRFLASKPYPWQRFQDPSSKRHWWWNKDTHESFFECLSPRRHGCEP